MITERICNKCGVVKPVSEFHKDKANPTGYYSRCKECKLLAMRDRWANDEEYRNKKKQYEKTESRREIHRNIMREKRESEEYRENHKRYMVNYRESTANKDRAKMLRAKPESRERERVAAKRYRENNKEISIASNLRSSRKRRASGKHQLYKNKYEKRRRENDDGYKLMVYSRNIIRKLVADKIACGKELVGCSKDKLKAHLESMFDINMSWENYGSYWHVDHIVPCNYFDFSIPVNQMICFNYRNLQPLEAKENILKSNTLPENYLEIIAGIKKELGLS